jgi:hypothetical protein
VLEDSHSIMAVVSPKAMLSIENNEEVKALLRESAGDPNYLVDGGEVQRQRAQVRFAFPNAHNCSILRELVLLISNHDEVEDFLLRNAVAGKTTDYVHKKDDDKVIMDFNESDSDGSQSVGSDDSSEQGNVEVPPSLALDSLFGQLQQIEFKRQGSISYSDDEDTTSWLIDPKHVSSSRSTLS